MKLPVQRVVAGILLISSVGWYVWARTTLLGALEAQDRVTLDLAQTLLRRELEASTAQVNDRCAIVADDPRLKAALAVPEADLDTAGAAISDVLAHLDAVRAQELAIVVAPDRRVLASWGPAGLVPTELSNSPLIERALSSAEGATERWAVDGAVLNIAARRIQLGQSQPSSGDAPQVLGVLVLGVQPSLDTNARLQPTTGVSSAWIVGGRVGRASEAMPPGLRERGESLQPGRTATIEHEGRWYLLRSESVETAGLPARVVLSCPRESQGDLFQAIRWLLYAPLFGAWMMGIAVLVGPPGPFRNPRRKG